MANLKSKYSINDNVKFLIRNITFSGKIIGIIFTKNGIFYDIDISGNIYRSIEEGSIQNI